MIYLPLLLCALSAHALTTSQLRHRSIYQIFTDRFARPDGQVTYCDPAQRDYCGGGWKGIEQHLDYIQRMGFDTSQSSAFLLLHYVLTLYGRSDK
jgi:alpha-amylase